MTASSTSAPPRRVDAYFRLAEIAILTVFVVSVALRGATLVESRWAEFAFIALGAACSQAFRIRLSAVDERFALGVGAGILGLALPAHDLLTTLLVWVLGLTAGATIAERDVVKGARIGGRHVLLGLAYSSVLGVVSGWGAPVAVSVMAATAAYLAIALLLWSLPAILADEHPVGSHLILQRIGMLFVLNAAIPIVSRYGQAQALDFITTDPDRMKLIMDLTLTTSVLSVVALVFYGYEARHRLDGVIRTARALPWPDDPDPLEQMKAFAAATLRVDRIEVRSEPPSSRFEIGAPFRTLSGEERHLVARRNPGRSPLLDRDRQALSAIAHIGQETLRVRGEATELRTRANTDPLTGLFNYRGFQAAIADVGSRRQERSGAAVVYIDLDGFKAVNDQYGHEAGNQLLREVARRLQEAVRPRDAVARVGGDEFVVLLRDIADQAHAEQVARRILSSAGAPAAVGPVVVPIRLSEGIAFSNDPAQPLDALVNEADALMYAKRGRRLVAGDESVGAAPSAALTGRRAIIASLITEGRLQVAYQPIVDTTKGTVVALEALVRGSHPAFGSIDAALLVHEARRLNLLDRLTEQVLERASADLRSLREVAAGLNEVHVNIELGQLSSGGTLERLQKWSRANPGIQLTVEMTENSVNLAGEDMLARLEDLRSRGVRLALDDFGQGHSTMLAIVEVPFDSLKIDRSLIASVTTSAKSVQVIRSLVRLCRNLGVGMIVEGVERAEERDVLLRLGVRHMQGYLFGRPQGVEALRARFAADGLNASRQASPAAP